MLDPFVERFLKAFEHLLERGDFANQAEFCDAMKIHSNYISGFREGRRPKITLDLLNKLYTIAGVSPLYLFTGRGPIKEEDRMPSDDLPEHIITALKKAALVQEWLEVERHKNSVLERLLEAQNEIISLYQQREQQRQQGE